MMKRYGLFSAYVVRRSTTSKNVKASSFPVLVDLTGAWLHLRSRLSTGGQVNETSKVLAEETG